MKFGTIGAGAVALAFGREALARGHEVVLSSRRGPDALVDKVAELGRGASGSSMSMKTASGTMKGTLVPGVAVSVEGQSVTVEVLFDPTNTTPALLGRSCLLAAMEAGFNTTEWLWR